VYEEEGRERERDRERERERETGSLYDNAFFLPLANSNSRSALGFSI